MPINPFRIGQLDLPANPQPVPIDMGSGIASLGESIGRYRDQQEVGRILSGAVDPKTGSLDLGRAASALAVTGRDPIRYLTAFTALQSEKRGEAAQRALEAHYLATQAETARANRQQEEFERQRLSQPQQQIIPETLTRPGYIIQAPKRMGEPPVLLPLPTPQAPSTVGPQSSAEDMLPPAARPVTAGPAMAERLPANFYPPPGGPPTPSEGPPFAPIQMAQAGPPVQPMPRPVPPSAPQAPSQSLLEPLPAPAAAPAPTPRNEAILQRMPEAGRTLVKGVAEYQIDPDKLGKDKEEIVAAAKLYRPDYSTAEYQKRITPPSAEVQGRIGLARAFLDKLDDRRDPQGNFIPGIKSRIAAGEMTGTLQGRMAAMLGQGAPGELRAAVDEGSEALLRALTGAGMNLSEAANYARRYQFSPIDDLTGGTRTLTNKLNGLETALRYTSTEMAKGHGDESFLKGFTSKFGEGIAIPRVKDDAEANALIGQARAALKRDPNSRNVIEQRLRDRGIRNPELMLGQ